MLNAVHKQIIASKAADILANSPVVLVFQLLGNVRSSQVANDLQKQLNAALPNSDIQTTCVKIKNTLGRFSPEVKLSAYLTANNVLVGFKQREAELQVTAHAKTELPDLFSGNSMNATSSTAVGATANGVKSSKLPHSTLATILDKSLNLSKKLPVALMASFYQGAPVKWKDLEVWKGLHEPTVMSELLAQLDTPLANIAEMTAPLDNLVAAIQPESSISELLYMLDHRSSGAEQQQAGPAAATT